MVSVGHFLIVVIAMEQPDQDVIVAAVYSILRIGKRWVISKYISY